MYVYLFVAMPGEKTELTLLMDLLGQYVKVIAQGLWEKNCRNSKQIPSWLTQ